MLVTLVICILLGLINAKKNNKALNCVVIFLMVYIMSCNNTSIDEMNLYSAYSDIKNGRQEIFDITNYLYVNVLMGIANKLGLSFGWFNFLTFLPAFIVLDKGLKKLVNNPSMVYVLFSLTSILLDTTLARQFIATVFVIYAIHYIIGEEKSVPKYMIFIAIATLFHVSSIVFLAYLILEFKISRKQIGISILGLSAGCVILTLLNNKQIIGISQFLSMIGSDKLNYGVSGGVENGWLYSFFIWMLMLSVSVSIRRYSLIYMKKRDIDIVDKITLMIEISLVFVSFSMMTMVYSRIFRPVSFLVFILIAKWNENSKIINRTNLIILVLAIIFIVCYSYIFNTVIFDYDFTVRAVKEGIPFWDSDYTKLVLPWVYK